MTAMANVFPIEISPLRRRPEDIPALAAHFVRSLACALNRPEPQLTRALLMRLQAYDWPGNVRELQNVIERALITSPGNSSAWICRKPASSLPPPVPLTQRVLIWC